MKVIDAHVHFWDVSRGVNEWVEHTSLPRSVLPTQLGADGFVHIEAHTEHHHPACEYKWLKNHFPDCAIKVICFLDFTLPIQEFEKNLVELTGLSDCVGVRQIMASSSQFAYSPFNKAVPKDLRAKLSLLAQHNMIFEAQFYPDQFLAVLDDIAASNATMAIEHAGLPVWEAKRNIGQWNILLREVAQHPDWHLKLSGLDMLNSAEHIEHCVERIVENVPANRLCYGSNYPVSYQANYDSWLNTLSNQINDSQFIQTISYHVAHRLYFS